jgi:hypothetical protein
MHLLLPITALFATILAAPTPTKYNHPLTVTLFNDVTGAHAASSIDTSAHFFVFGSNLFRNSTVSRNGTIIGTSIQLSFPDLPLPDGYSCGVYSGEKTIGELSARQNYLDLDGQPGKAVETDVTGFIIKCDMYIVGQD